jgi:hypothetical protein
MQWTTWEYDTTTDIEELSDNAFSIYPNPSRGLVNIDFENRATTRVKIYDANGKLIIERAMANSHNQLDISDQPKGVYFITINQNGNEISKKLILE